MLDVAMLLENRLGQRTKDTGVFIGRGEDAHFSSRAEYITLLKRTNWDVSREPNVTFKNKSINKKRRVVGLSSTFALLDEVENSEPEQPEQQEADWDDIIAEARRQLNNLANDTNRVGRLAERLTRGNTVWRGTAIHDGEPNRNGDIFPPPTEEDRQRNRDALDAYNEAVTRHLEEEVANDFGTSPLVINSVQNGAEPMDDQHFYDIMVHNCVELERSNSEFFSRNRMVRETVINVEFRQSYTNPTTVRIITLTGDGTYRIERDFFNAYPAQLIEERIYGRGVAMTGRTAYTTNDFRRARRA
jgi:hypothetical protein